VETIKEFIQNHKKLLSRLYQFTIYGIALGILIYQLMDIGLSNVLESIPTNPLVYIIAVLLFFVLPISEYFGYSRFLKLDFKESIPIFIKKRIYNKNLVNYLGEFDFYLWLTKRMPERTKRQLFDIIKDNNIISSLASILIVVVLLLYLVYHYELSLVVSPSGNLLFYVIGGVVLFLIAAVLSKKFRIYSLSFKDTLYLTNLHLTRMIISSGLQILQWYLAITTVSFYELFIFLAVQLVISRIPMLPGKDLLFISGSLILTNYIPISTEELAAIMILNNLIDKLLSVGSLVVFSLTKK
jgi:hypothetical protein